MGLRLRRGIRGTLRSPGPPSWIAGFAGPAEGSALRTSRRRARCACSAPEPRREVLHGEAVFDCFGEVAGGIAERGGFLVLGAGAHVLEARGDVLFRELLDEGGGAFGADAERFEGELERWDLARLVGGRRGGVGVKYSRCRCWR